MNGLIANQNQTIHASLFLGWAAVTSFLSGAGVLVVELVCTRVLAPFFGQSMLVWTNVIGVVLLGLAIGSAIGGRLADRWPEPRMLALLLCGAAGLLAVSAALARRLARWIIPEELPLEAAIEFLSKGSLVTALVCFMPPVILLGAVSPFLVRCSVDRWDTVGRCSGLLYSAATLGSIVATFLTYHVLLPQFGINGTLWTSSSLLAAASVPLWLSRRCPAVGTLTALAALLLTGAGLRWGGAAFGGAARGTLIDAADSPYQHIEVRWREDLRAHVLTLDEGLDSVQSVLPQSGILTGCYYDYFALLPFLQAHTHFTNPEIKELSQRILVLGLAGGTHVRQVLAAIDDWNRQEGFPRVALEVEVVGVEIDAEVVRMARDRLALPVDLRFKVVEGIDARFFVGRLQPPFDIIIIDCYSQQSFVPDHLATVEFFQEVRQRLKPNGLVALNVFGYGGCDPVVQSMAGSLQRAFENEVVCMSLPNTTNFMIYASPRSPDLLTRVDENYFPPVLRSVHASLRINPFRSWFVGDEWTENSVLDEDCSFAKLQEKRLSLRAEAVLSIRDP